MAVKKAGPLTGLCLFAGTEKPPHLNPPGGPDEQDLCIAPTSGGECARYRVSNRVGLSLMFTIPDCVDFTKEIYVFMVPPPCFSLFSFLNNIIVLILFKVETTIFILNSRGEVDVANILICMVIS